MDGTQLGGGAAQRRLLALLAALAAHSNAGMRREALLSLLWPDADPDRGRHALAQSLYHIRRTLSCDDLFVLNGAEILLNPVRISSDVGRFQAALAVGDDRGALDHYEGPFMDGFLLPSALEFDQWTAAVRFRLQASAARAMERVAARAEASEDWTTAIDFHQRLVGLDPLSAGAVARLMRAMLAAGDRPAAFRAGQQHVQLVRQQLEMEPEQPVVDLMASARSMRDVPRRQEAAARDAVRVHDNESAIATAANSPPVEVRSEKSRQSSRAWRSVAVGLALASVATAVAIFTPATREGRVDSTSPLRPEERIVIAPFRVAGSDLTYLREGMVELLSSRFARDGAIRAVDPGRVLGTWQRANLTEVTDAPQSESMRLARQLGATRVVIGGVVGNATRIVLSARLVGADKGETQAEASVEGSTDSVTTLVDRLAAKLVASSAGEGDRLSDRLTPSLEALRDFLEGQAAYHRGDYVVAVPAFERALARDSTFALAALQLALAADRLNDAEQHDRALAIAWANRDDLNERDRAHLTAFAGPRYPRPSTESEQIAAWDRAVSLAPDRAEVWYELGERLFRSGGVAAVGNAHVRAKATLARALELQPAHQRARRLLIMLGARSGDTALLRQIASPAALRDSVGELADFLRWRVALAFGDSASLRRIRKAIPALNRQSLRAIAMSSLNDAVGLDDGERAAKLSLERAGSQSQSFDALMEEHAIALNAGRPHLALAVTTQIANRYPGSHSHLRLRVLDALYSDGEEDAANAAADSLARFADAPLLEDPDDRAVQLADACVLEQWRLQHGATAGARRVIGRLRSASLPRRLVPLSANQLACAQIIETMLAVQVKQRDAHMRVAILDSLMLSGPGVSDASSYTHILVGRLFQELGDRESALVAFRRRTYMMGWPRYLATARREEAELAASMGDTAIARSSLARYLALRRNPEPQLAIARDTVRRHVTAAYAGVDPDRQDNGAPKKRAFIRGGRSHSAARRAGFDR